MANTSTSNASRWTVGNATQTGVGVYSLYITNDGISNTYSAVASNSYAYRKIHIPQGMYDISYNWASQGYVSGSTAYAYIRAFLIPATTTLSGGSALTGLSQTSVPAGAIAVDGGSGLYGRSSWQTYSNPLVQVPTTQDYYLVFYWFNNTSTISQRPGAIDNICIEPVSCPQPINLTKNNLGNGCVEINWTDYGNPQPTGWIVEYGQYGFTAGTGNTRYVTSKPDTICGLMDDMTYDFMVRAICPNDDTSTNRKNTCTLLLANTRMHRFHQPYGAKLRLHLRHSIQYRRIRHGSIPVGRLFISRPIRQQRCYRPRPACIRISV